MEEKKQVFEYNYSAKQQEEVRRIREKYVPKEESKLEQLKKMDAHATRSGTIASVTLGVISTLILGVGMCCTMIWADGWFIPGIIIGCIGMVGIFLAYPLYKKMVKQSREKLAPEILRLTDELLQQDE